jgi:hypothetical protein
MPDSRKLAGSLKYVSKAKITMQNGFDFPFDMLRYDHCHPASSEDATAIWTLVTETIFGRGENDMIEVTLVKYHETKDNPGWTPGRWQSFGAQLEIVDAYS